MWRRMCEVALGGGQRIKRPSGRVLLCGAVTFLWERERIGNDDVISCLKEYDDRVQSQLHVTLELPPPVPSQEVTPSQNHVVHFRHELQTLLQEKSEKQLSQLPLVGLQKMGPISCFSVRAQLALHTVRYKAADRLHEVKTYVYSSLKVESSGKAEGSCDCDLENETTQLEDDACGDETLEDFNKSPVHVGDEVCAVHSALESSNEGSVKAVNGESMLAYYLDHSKRHMADLPLVGLRPPGPAYSLSIQITDLCRRLFGGESYLPSQASFLEHLGLVLCDVPSISPFFDGLQVSRAAEGFTASSMKESVVGAGRKAWALLNASPRAMLVVLDSISGQSDNSEGDGEECERYPPEETGDPQSQVAAQRIAEHLQSSQQFVGNTSNEGDLRIDTDSYLAQGGWERFADARNCTVYRKLHQMSGLYMYKVIGRYPDISVREFLDVQVDHGCRKSWDTYVQKLETVDVDLGTESEVIHWIMRFPFPMSSREYLYVRRVWVNKNAAVLINRSVDHPAVPECRKYVRVQNYLSEMVMQPHTSTDEAGFEFELTYFDDPQTNLPSSFVNWVATAAMPDFLTKVHSAAVQRRDASSSSSGLPTISAF